MQAGSDAQRPEQIGVRRSCCSGQFAAADPKVTVTVELSVPRV
jgi:hypothetical protein